jgi:8-hydroxy-5-deazaflavin:NADPH oxidoreductase
MLGSGLVGRTLGAGLAAEGHTVVIGTRDPESEAVRDWLAATGGEARATSYTGAAAWCELAFFVPVWSHAEDVVVMAGAANLAGKTVVDVTNPLRSSPDGGYALMRDVEDGAGALVQRWLPGSRVVKAFNGIGYNLMVHPRLPGGSPMMAICGDSADAKAEVAALSHTLGWEPVDFGGIEFSGYLEALAIVWLRYRHVTSVRTHALRMLVG